jgi:hypothetical protein
MRETVPGELRIPNVITPLFSCELKSDKVSHYASEIGVGSRVGILVSITPCPIRGLCSRDCATSD